MPNIPLIQSRSSATTGGSIEVYASDKAAGAGVGAAIQNVGNELGNAAERTFAFAEKERGRRLQEDLANANGQFDQTSAVEKARQSTPASGQGFAATANEAVQKSVTDYANKIEDREVRRLFLLKQQNEAANRRETFAAEEAHMGRAYSQNEANKTLEATTNRVLANPNTYDTELQKSIDVINARPGLTDTQRTALRDAEGQRLAASRFQGMLMTAKTVEQADSIIAELKDEKWSSKIASTSYSALLERAKSTRNQIETGEDAKFSAALSSVKERVAAGVQVPIAEMDQLREMAKSMPTSRHQVTFHDTMMKAEYLATGERGASPVQMRQSAERTKSNAVRDPTIGGAISAASGMTQGRVSVSYLTRMTGRESNYDPNAKNPSSSATGLTQFTEGTWLEMVRNYPEQMGLERGASQRQLATPEGRAELLKLRTDATMSIKAGALYADQNAKVFQQTFGSAPTDTDLYLMHFLGGGGGPAFLRQLRADSTSPIFPTGNFTSDQIAANKSVFYKANGEPRTFGEVYRNISSSFTGSQSAAQHSLSTFIAGRADAKEAELKRNMMGVAVREGIATPNQLQSPSDWTRLGVDAARAAQNYGVPLPDVKPFDEAQAAALTKKIKEGTSDEVLGILANLQNMGGDMARAGAKQIGAEDHVFEHAAGLALDGGAPTVAKEVVQGKKAIEANPAWAVPRKELAEIFDREYGAALSRQIDGAPGASKSNRQAILDSATALYVGRKGGQQLEKIDKEGFKAAVQAVTGGQQFGVVNGAQMVLPKGVTASEFDTALDRLDPADLTRMSANGQPPRYRDGSPVQPDEIAREGKFKHVGGAAYVVMMADGKPLGTVTETPGPDGKPVRQFGEYRLTITGADVKSLAQRPTLPYVPPGPAKRASAASRQRRQFDEERAAQGLPALGEGQP